MVQLYGGRNIEATALGVTMLGLALFAGTFFGLMHGCWAASERVALVLGNSAYQHTVTLKNPGNDSTDVAAALHRLGFDVILRTDADRSAFREVIADFDARLEGAEVGLFFYAGHGLQVDGKNYLVPVDSQLKSEVDLSFEAIPLDLIQRTMEARVKTLVMFLDACQDNPLAQTLARSMKTRSGGLERGLARVDTGLGSFVAFSTLPGQVALDGTGRNSPFTTALLHNIETPGLDVTGVLQKVRKEVVETTGGKQVPWDNSTLVDALVLKSGNPPTTPAAATDTAPTPAPSLGPKSFDIASIDPSDTKPSAALPAQEVARRAQLALGKLGCYLGKADGVWGGQSKRALERFYRFADMEQQFFEPMEDLIVLLESTAGPVCPVEAHSMPETKAPTKKAECFVFNNKTVCN